ncbi:MAG: hypothetical protein RLZZ621_375 [Gemmatimonadota bacterium]|jgi:hypothetical protein
MTDAGTIRDGIVVTIGTVGTTPVMTNYAAIRATIDATIPAPTRGRMTAEATIHAGIPAAIRDS